LRTSASSQRLRDRQQARWPALASVQARFRGQFAYVDGHLPDGQVLPLCRLRYAGSASRWGFAVYLTGQDGFSPDQARGFAPIPQEFQFGVCAAPSSDPHCTVDPGTVPKAMDVITPAGVFQVDELD